MKYHYYGMRCRGCSLGCQPKGCQLVTKENDGKLMALVSKNERDYHDIIRYDRELTVKELRAYELDFLGALII